jgi:hypothetical protein
MGVWEKYGLLSPRFLDARPGDPRYAQLPRGNRFRLALEEQGGLFLKFGQYLAGRADLLPSPHLRQLSLLRPQKDLTSRRQAGVELGRRVELRDLLRSGPRSHAHLGRWGDRAVIVEFYPSQDERQAARDWRAFRKAMQRLDDGPEAVLGRDFVLEHFWEWLELAGDIDRKRRIIGNFQQAPANSLWRYPKLLHELQTERCLVYEDAGGDELQRRVEGPSDSVGPALLRWAEGLLEQTLLFALIDAEARLDSCYIGAGDRLNYRCIPVLAPVPVEWSYELLQYMACVVAGNSVRALQMISRIISSRGAYSDEQILMRELSALQPELKINQVTPPSVTALENYWRALAAAKLMAPGFLELFHRQWTILGQYNGDRLPASDTIAEALWPVMGRVLRYQVSENLTAEKAREWVMSSGLLLFSTARQAGLTLEQIRDNDLAMVTDHQEHEPRGSRARRRVFSVVRTGVWLVVFLVALQLAFGSGFRPFQLLAGMIAAFAAVALTLSAAKVE